MPYAVTKPRGKTLRHAVASATLLMASTTALAVQLPINIDGDDETEETLELYGVIRGSVDYADPDAKGERSNVGVSSNSSLLGFRGSYALKDQPLTFVWQIEQGVNLDEDADQTFNTRDTFAGVNTNIGLFRFGRVNTPYKLVGVRNTLYDTTVGEPLGILGQASNPGVGVRLDQRAANSINWNGNFADVKLALQYSGDSHQSAPGNLDDSNRGSISGSVEYTLQGLTLTGGFINYKNRADNSGDAGDIDAWRLAAQYRLDALLVGGIFEDINTTGNLADGRLERSAYGAFGQYSLTPKTAAGLQWMHAESSSWGKDSADQISIALYHQLAPRLTTYVIASHMINDKNAKYRLGDFAHGDKINTDFDGDPKAVSIGAAFKF